VPRVADLSELKGCRRAQGAGYRHGSRRSCLKGTRETVLNEIESWANDFNLSPVFWLNGLAGTGKTTIAQTVSERMFADGQLGASFFCSRDFEDRSDLHFIFPTIAFQLAYRFPKFRSDLVRLLRLDPDVAHESLYGQMEKLIVKPLKSADVSTVIVIDALDECKDEEPSSAILSVLARLVDQIPMVRFFITGRPEPRIRTGFRLPMLMDLTSVFVLHDVDPPLINSDIRFFLKHELSEIAQRRQLGRWPSDESIDLLCSRAAGLFVYAVATVKFLDSNFRLPQHQLDVILKLPECTAPEGKTRFNPRTTLDSLYTSILQMAFSEGDPEVYSMVRSTIGAVVMIVNPLSPSGIAKLVDLDPGEVILLLTSVQSLLALGEDSDQPVKAFHKSFPDFITDPSRCIDPRFYISPSDIHLELVRNCLRMINAELEQNLLSLPDYALNSEVKDLETRIDDRINATLRYACLSWHNHLTRTEECIADVVSHLRTFLEQKFLAWLEVVSVIRAVGGAVAGLERLMAWLLEVRFCPSRCRYSLITYRESGGQRQAASQHRQRLFAIRDQIFRGHQCLRHPHLSFCTGTLPHVVDYPKPVLSPAHHPLAENCDRNPGFMDPDYRNFWQGQLRWILHLVTMWSICCRSSGRSCGDPESAHPGTDHHPPPHRNSPSSHGSACLFAGWTFNCLRLRYCHHNLGYPDRWSGQ